MRSSCKNSKEQSSLDRLREKKKGSLTKINSNIEKLSSKFNSSNKICINNFSFGAFKLHGSNILVSDKFKEMATSSNQGYISSKRNLSSNRYFGADDYISDRIGNNGKQSGISSCSQTTLKRNEATGIDNKDFQNELDQFGTLSSKKFNNMRESNNSAIQSSNRIKISDQKYSQENFIN